MSELDPEKVTHIGKIDFRNKQIPFGIKRKDRTRHMYVIGKTGMGKSTFLENLAIQDINNGEGVCFIDPHGSTAEKLLDFIPESRIKDVIYFAPFDSEFPIGLNVLEQVTPDKRHLVANGIMAAFKKLFKDQFSARMEYILNNIILALLENEGQSLLGVNRMLTDKEYRKEIVSNVKDPTVRDFWLVEYASYTDRFAAEAAPAIQNKVGQFIANPLIRNIIGQEKTSFDVRKIMDERKILIVNLSKGKVGEGNANLIGSLLITKIYLAAMSRADASSAELAKLPPFYFYVDEFQNFANDSFASILSEARKYNLALTVAHQYVDQMEDEVKSAVFGNVGTMIVFRVGASDAEIFEKEFAPYFTMDDVVNLSAFQFYLRLMIDGAGSKPFSARSLDPIVQPPHSNAEAVIEYTRATYGKPRFAVEDEITRFYTPKPKEEKKRDTIERPREQNEHHTSEYSQQNKTRTSAPQDAPTRESQRMRTLAPQEKVVKVRKITDATPLPPKPFHKEKRENAQSVDTYAVNRSVEEAFHTPPLREDKKQHFSTSTKKEPPQPVLEKMSVPREEAFQGTSLKEALKRAMEEHEQETHKERSAPKEEQKTEPKQDTATSVHKKEVSEDVLRKLLQDD
jgi:tRNA isopentenyl-2-thiomethyl-A-37 hydroxylase MiaE